MRKRMVFYLALCLVTGSTLVLQLIQVRILSVVTWYHMGFFIISMAMFGLTAGSIYVYMMKKKFMRSSFNANLSFYTMLFSLSLFTCTLLQMTLPLVLFKSLASLLLWLELSILIAIPFFFSGIVVSLALSQSPYPIGYVYAVDLVGAGIGAISTILLLNNIDAVSALLFLCFITMCASLLFKTDTKPVFKFCSVLFFLSCSMINNALDYGLQPIMSKGSLENGSSFDKVEWNSFSRIVLVQR